MSGDSPAAVVVDGVVGAEVAVERGVAVPADTRPLLVAGIDQGGVARAFLVTPDGEVAIAVALDAPTTAVVVGVPQAAGASSVLLASNVARKGAVIHNATDSILYVKLGAGGTTTDFSAPLLPRATWELPFPVYRGVISGEWATGGAGTAQVTETT